LFGGLASSLGQNVTEDTYCIKLKKTSNEDYFAGVKLDSVPPKWRPLYEDRHKEFGKVLSRFGERPLQNDSGVVFRAMDISSFSSSRNPESVHVIKIEKQGEQVVITVKRIQKMKDSTVYVHKKVCGLDVWSNFEALAEKHFLSEPSAKLPSGAVHDGSTMLYEGRLRDTYHFLTRHAMEVSMRELYQFLFSASGAFYDANCKKDTREN